MLRWGILLLALGGMVPAAAENPAPPAASSGTAVAGASAVSPLDPNIVLARSQAVVGGTVKDTLLIDRNHRPMPLSRYRGKPLLVSFIYTGCFQACPVSTRGLLQAVREARRTLGPGKFAVLSVGFNVPFDTPQALAAFARQHGADFPDWEFATADAATIRDLTRSLGFSYVATPKGFDHISQVTVLDASGRIYRQIYGDTPPVQEVGAALKDLLLGAPSPTPGLSDLWERVRLLCTVYDSRSGRYRLDYSLFLEIAIGAIILFAVSFSLFKEWRRQRQLPRS